MAVCRNNRWGDAEMVSTSRTGGGAGRGDAYETARLSLMALINAMATAISAATPTAAWRPITVGRRRFTATRCGMRAFNRVTTAAAIGTTKRRPLTYRP